MPVASLSPRSCERLPEPLAFLEDMSRDDVQLIVVEPATG
jgi:hypothetical protein